ncbi:MAG: sigma-70 family RNA polymerase sigma factor [Chthoniobacterales bacterium]|nr:sigma-70 family RNA polymerase sigma factor [Chthoniobacterales bacterium]
MGFSVSKQIGERSCPNGFDDFVEQNFASAYRFAFCLALAHDRATRIVEATFGEAKALQESEAKVDKVWVLEALHRKWRACHPAKYDTNGSEDYAVAGERSIRIEDVAHMDCDRVLKILHRMSPAHRLVLSLFYFEQLSHEEIARILELRPETVFSRLAQAKVLLRQTLERSRGDASLHSVGPEHSAEGSG